MNPNRRFYQDMVRAATVREVDRYGAWLALHYRTEPYHASATGKRHVGGFRVYAARDNLIRLGRRSA